MVFNKPIRSLLWPFNIKPNFQSETAIITISKNTVALGTLKMVTNLYENGVTGLEEVKIIADKQKLHLLEFLVGQLGKPFFQK